MADLTARLQDQFGTRVRDVRLFGSRARGDANLDSDLDVLVRIDGLSNAERLEIWRTTGDLLTDHGVVVSVLVMSTEHWDELRRLDRVLPREIDRDGIALLPGR